MGPIDVHIEDIFPKYAKTIGIGHPPSGTLDGFSKTGELTDFYKFRCNWFFRFSVEENRFSNLKGAIFGYF